MPLYDMKCPTCDESLEHLSLRPVSAEELDVSCPGCGTRMVKQISIPRRDSWPEDGIVLDHIADEPMHFARKKDLQRYCKEKGLSSGALL